MKTFKPFQLVWNEKVDPERGCHYLTRWCLFLFGYGIRVHHWINNDDQRYFHDHPWWMAIFILKGGYTDISPNGEQHLKAGNFVFRKAEHKHTVRVDKGGCWSLLLTGRVERHFGFWVPGRNKLLRPFRYFKRFGHHQCEN